MEGRTLFCRKLLGKVTSGASWGVYGYPPNACHSPFQENKAFIEGLKGS